MNLESIFVNESAISPFATMFSNVICCSCVCKWESSKDGIHIITFFIQNLMNMKRMIQKQKLMKRRRVKVSHGQNPNQHPPPTVSFKNQQRHRTQQQLHEVLVSFQKPKWTSSILLQSHYDLILSKCLEWQERIQ